VHLLAATGVVSWNWVGAFVIAIAGSAITAYVAVRRASGRVGTSEAADLWEESRSIRQDYASRIKELNETVSRCEERLETQAARIDDLEQKNEKLYLENGNLRRMIEEHERTIAELRTQLHDVSEENKRLRVDNAQLKGEATKLRKRVSELERNGD